MFDEWGNPITGKYKVNPGDNLTKISNELEVPIDSLVSFNRLSNPDNIKVGQTLLFRKEPGMLDNISRLIFGENEDSKKINNQINKNILNPQKPQEEDPEYVKLKKTIFKNKDINNFARVMSSIYSHEMRKRGLPLHNIDNLVKQDALESNYGISTRGNGYNLGGVKVFNDKEKLGTLYKDGFYYRNFKDLGDYVNYKLNLLENDYGGVISAPAEEFIDRIHGNNPNKKVYSGNKKHYINSFKGMISLSSALNKLRTSSNIQFKQYGGILLSPLDYLPDYSVKDIKVDPSIFNSWEAIKSDYIEPTITTKDESLFNLSDYILATQPKYIIKNKKSTKEEKEKEEKEEELSKEEKSNNVEISNSISNSYKYSSKAQWVKELSESYKKAGITNPNALKYLIAQDALESGWGKSAQGNFNFGNLTTGSSWKGDYVKGRDKDANGNPISQKFRSYNSMDEYTRDKVEFLTRLYDFNQNDNLQTFISKLTGNNKGHRRYAEARNYGESLTKVFQSLISKHQEGGVLLFGNPETSEMLTYQMPDGSIKTIPNTKAGFVSGTDPVGSVVVEGAVLNKPLGWAFGKAINWAKGLLNKNKGKEYTERLIKALGNKYKGGSDSEMFTPDQRYFIEYLKSLNVDVSRFGSSDIRRLQNLRKKVLLETIPEDERVGLVSFLKNNSGTSLDIDLHKSKDIIGNISAKSTNKGSNIGYVESYRPKSERHVSEDLYNTTIETSKQIGSPGIISGKRLLSPEQTYKIWNKFPNKKLLSKNGEHTFNSGDNVIKSGESYTINNGDVYLLKEPSREVKTKASNVFNPSIIDKNGKMTIDWNNKDILKSLIPIYLYNENTN